MTNRASVTVEVDPISRIEGHLGAKVTTNASGIITEANVHGNLWRGFENFLLGRNINDAITFVQRICGVCPVPHGQTSTYAVDAVLGYSRNHITFAWDAATATSSDGYGVPKKAVHIRNLVSACDTMMSTITHFYHLAAPSYVQGPAIPPWTPWFANSLYATALQNPGGTTALPRTMPANGFPVAAWDAVILSYVKALRVRRLAFEAGALFAGRMPMTSCFVGGGVTDSGTENLTAKCNKFKQVMQEVGAFVVQEYVPIALALGALYQEFDSGLNGNAQDWGGGLGRFLAWGAYPDGDDTGANAALLSAGGYFDVNAPADNFTVTTKAQVYSTWLTGARSVPTNLTESIAKSRYDIYSADAAAYTADSGNAAYPGAVSRTKPNRAKAGAYTYMKAPRWNGKPCEVGPLARLAVAGLYPVTGATLASVVPGYTAYVKTAAGNTGLDPKMISADVAVGLLQSALAELWIGTTHITDVSTLSRSAIVTAYTDPNAVIMGAVPSWVIALTGGLSTMDRLRARALEGLVLIQAMIGGLDKSGASIAFTGATIAGTSIPAGWINKLAALTGSPALDFVGSTWRNRAIPTGTVQGWGAHEAARGALMHQTTINAGKITKYQCIVPTTWNGSPKDAANQRGAFEAALINVPFDAATSSFTNQAGGTTTTQSGIEVLRVLQSFDPCIACAVH
jgi:hydrogenase large subunit